MDHEPRRRGNSMAETAYWDEKPLEALTTAEWESLCDGCGRCCLVKLEDEDTGRVYFTEIGCRLLDVGDVPLLRLCQPPAAGSRLPETHARSLGLARLAAADLRLPASGRGQAPGLVASARLRLAGDGARGGDFGARPRRPDRDRPQDRRLCRAYRQLAGSIAARRACAPAGEHRGEVRSRESPGPVADSENPDSSLFTKIFASTSVGAKAWRRQA